MGVRLTVTGLAVLALAVGLSGCGSTPSSSSGWSGDGCGDRVRVRPGDSLSTIAQRCGVPWRTIARINGIDPPYMIRAGSWLKLKGRPVQHASGPAKTRARPLAMRAPLSGTPRPVEGGVFYPADIGTAVRVVAPGRVEAVRSLPFYGRVVLVSHREGYVSVYGYLLQPQVRPGQRLESGAAVGTSGVNPETGEPGLYFELRHGKRVVPFSRWERWQRNR